MSDVGGQEVVDHAPVPNIRFGERFVVGIVEIQYAQVDAVQPLEQLPEEAVVGNLLVHGRAQGQHFTPEDEVLQGFRLAERRAIPRFPALGRV